MLPVPGLRQERMRRLMTQEELADQSGIGRVTINRIEHGQLARLSTIRKLAAALRVEADVLLRERSDEGQLEAA